MRLVALSNLMRGIEPGLAQSMPVSPILFSGCHPPARIPATSIIPWTFCGLLHVPGERAHLSDLSSFSLSFSSAPPALTAACRRRCSPSAPLRCLPVFNSARSCILTKLRVERAISLVLIRAEVPDLSSTETSSMAECVRARLPVFLCVHVVRPILYNSNIYQRSDPHADGPRPVSLPV
nr:uncharacterized protein LOC127325945 [Lolium perenne]